MAEVGTKKVFENDKTIVWELFLEPGERIERHTHRHGYMFYVTAGSALELFDADDNYVTTIELHTGQTVAYRLEDDQLYPMEQAGPPAPATHSARNAGSASYREILVEWK